MKNILLLTAIFLSGVFTQAELLKGDIHVKMKGVVCAFCAQSLKKTFSKLPEVENVKVSLEEKYMHLTLKKDTSLDSEKILNQIKDAGYEGTIGH